MTATHTDTIVAVSSSPGRSVRGLVRISGPATRAILQDLTNIDGDPEPRRLTTARLALSIESSPTLPILLTFFPAPRSYTGQDMVELQCPGNPALLDRLLHAIVAGGARPAEAGEFTFRAYLAGKLDLTQAEGVGATIAAVSDSQLQAASLLREGKLGRLATALVDELGTQLALVEAGIDFTDQDDVVPVTPGDLDAALSRIAARLDELLSRSRSWGALEALPRVVMVGAPSTGKSTLFNALLGRSRAVVSATAGTTRDILAEPLTLTDDTGRCVEVMLIDMAGLDAPRHTIDEQMQRAARDELRRADLLLLIDDHPSAPPLAASRDRADSPSTPSASRDVHDSPSTFKVHSPSIDLQLPPSTPAIHVHTKSDLQSRGATTHSDTETEPSSPPSHATSTTDAAHATTAPASAEATTAPPTIAVSAHTGHHLDALRRAIVDHVGARAVSVVGDMLALQPRHEAALRSAANELTAARRLLAPPLDDHSLAGVELIAGALRAALDHLAGLGGELTPDDVIGRVFATFCIGK